MDTVTNNLLKSVLIAWALLIPTLAEGGIAVSPLKQEISLKPGQTGKFRVVITNNVRPGRRAFARTVELSLTDVKVAEDGLLSFPQAGTTDYSACDWIRMNDAKVVIEPGEAKVIEGTIDAPVTAAGEYYATMMVTIIPESQDPQGVAIQYRIASGLFVTVTGRTFPRKASIEKCQVIFPPLDEESQIVPRIATVLRNTGLARFDAGGKVRLIDANSRVVFTAPLRSKRACVFGGDSRLFETLLDRAIPAGTYTLNIEMDYESQWTKARHQQTLEITSQQASLLSMLHDRSSKLSGGTISVAPLRLSCDVMGGSFRTMSVNVKNTAEDPAPFVVTMSDDEEEGSSMDWWTIQPDTFELAPGMQKSVVLLLKTPVDALPGRHGFDLTVMATRADGTVAQTVIPVEAAVKGRR